MNPPPRVSNARFLSHSKRYVSAEPRAGNARLFCREALMESFVRLAGGGPLMSALIQLLGAVLPFKVALIKNVATSANECLSTRL